MPDIKDSEESLVINVDVETDEAKKRLDKWNKELAKATTEAEKQQKLLSIASSPVAHVKGKTDIKQYKADIRKIKEQAKQLALSYGKPKVEREINLDDSLKATKVEEKAVETLSKAKGTFIESGELLGKVFSTKEFYGKTVYKTEEIANGFKKVREYVGLANGELYKMSETSTQVQQKKSWADNLFDGIGNNLQKKTKNSTKIFKRIGSIITYRIARTVLSAFTNSIKQGFDLLSQDNTSISNIKDTFASISSTFQVSITTIMIPLFETLANVIEPLADDFLKFANAVSYANAKISGQTQYFQLSREKIDAYAKSLKNSNKQLSELDKFASLNGSNKADLGSYIDIADTSRDIINNQDKYQSIVDFVQTLSDIIGEIITSLKYIFESARKNTNWLVPTIALVITAMNPLLGILGSVLILMSNAEGGAKVLAAACMTLAGAFIGVGIAKTFATNPIAGLAAGAIGGALAASIFAIAGSFNTGSTSTSTGSLTYSGGSLGRSSDLYQGIESASTRAYSSGVTTIRGDVYIDGTKVGKVIESSVYSEGSRVGHFGGNK